MDQIDINLSRAWRRISAQCRADRVESLKRYRRTHGFTMRGVPRACCLVLRAADTRINPHTATIEFDPDTILLPGESTEQAVTRGVEHSVTISGETIRNLIRPIMIPWPGVPKSRAATILGLHERSLHDWLRLGTLALRAKVPASMLGHPGKKVPIVYTPSPINPGAMIGGAPDPIWGSLWHYQNEKIPLDFQMKAMREPRWRIGFGKSFERGGPKFVGWDWICPGMIIPKLSDADGDESFEEIPCGRRVRNLYGPAPIWTLPQSMDARLDLELPEDCGLSGRWNPGFVNRFAGRGCFACGKCWQVRGLTLTCSSGWNDFVTHISGGLLYGHEVERPAVEAPLRRKRRFYTHKHPKAIQLRQRMLPLLLKDLPRERIARMLGVKIALVDYHTKQIYRAHGVHSRAGLAKKLGVPFARRVEPLAERIIQRRKVVLPMRRRGMSLQRIADELGINIKTAHSDVIALRAQGRLHESSAVLRVSFSQAKAPTAIRLSHG